MRRLFASAALLALAMTAAAEEVRPRGGVERVPSFEGMTPQKRVIHPDRVGDTAPLLVQVPRLSGTRELVAEVVFAGEKTLVRETIQLDGNVPERSAVRLLASQATELGKLRRIAAGARGQELQIRITAGERTVARGLFADLDAAGAELVGAANVAGTTRVIEVSHGLKSRNSIGTNGFQPDPACEQGCYEEYSFCMEYICDPRTTCQGCIDQYNNCYYACPQVCVDPKDVDQFERTVYLGSDYHGAHCYVDPRDDQSYIWDVYLHHYRVETVRRTEYCNGSYSEEVISSYNVSHYCFYKWAVNPSCGIPVGTVPSTQICG